jgi:hypothetical protein
MSYVNLDTSRNNCLKRVSSEATLGNKSLLRPSAIGGMQLAWRQPVMLPFQWNLDTHETSPQLRSLKCAEKTKSPSLELLVFTNNSSRTHQGNRHFASNRQLGDRKVMTRQFLPSEVSRVECFGQSVSQSLACIDSNTRFNNRVKYSNKTDSPDQIGTIHVHFSFIQYPHTQHKITWEAAGHELAA